MYIGVEVSTPKVKGVVSVWPRSDFFFNNLICGIHTLLDVSSPLPPPVVALQGVGGYPKEKGVSLPQKPQLEVGACDSPPPLC